MKFLVTGAAGFIGSFFSEYLILKGHEVIGIDNFFRGKKENLPSNPKFTFYNIDLTTGSQTLSKIIQDHSPEILVHYAAINGTQYFYDIPWQVLNSNVLMTQNVLNACYHSSIKKIIYASSSEVYGDPIEIPTPESHPIILRSTSIRDSYAASKVMGEFYVKLYTQQLKIDYLILRIFNTYGPRMDISKYGQVIPEFIGKINESKDFKMIGDGHETRSFCFIQDHVRLVLKLVLNISNEIINVGNDKEINILQLAQLLHNLLQKPFNPIFLEGRLDDHKRRCPNITKLKTLIRDSPSISLEDGLLQTLRSYSHH